MGVERRRFNRYPASQKARAAMNGEDRTGSIVDLSAGGAGVELDDPFAEDTEIELDIEDVGRFGGFVARSGDDFMGVEFELDEDEEDELIAGIMRLQTGLLDEEDD